MRKFLSTFTPSAGGGSLLLKIYLILAALTLTASFAGAETEPRKSPFGVGPAPAAGPAIAGAPGAPAVTPSIADRAWHWLLATQQYYQREMATAVRQMKSASPYAAALALASISFMYGVLHAAGPGHGKAVISSYVLANRQTLRRGIYLSFLSAFFQACSAILLVCILALALKATSLTMKSAENWIETVSWAAVALAGVWLLYRQIGPFWRTWGRTATTPAITPASTHAGCGHDHEPGHVHTEACNHGPAPATVSSSAPAITRAPGAAQGRAKVAFGGPPATTPTHEHGHDHVHSADCGCGHAHMPEPSQLEGAWNWRRALTLSLTVGVRPCTGAILVMVFAMSQGILWAGVFATFMMSLGTALTVSALAALAVGSRDLAVRLAGKDASWTGWIEKAIGVGGALLVIVLGTAGFVISLSPTSPF